MRSNVVLQNPISTMKRIDEHAFKQLHIPFLSSKDRHLKMYSKFCFCHSLISYAHEHANATNI